MQLGLLPSVEEGINTDTVRHECRTGLAFVQWTVAVGREEEKGKEMRMKVCYFISGRNGNLLK